MMHNITTNNTYSRVTENSYSKTNCALSETAGFKQQEVVSI